ncbi:hypothetical protein COLO4_24982 [Corchorus olitorius]|uniref:Uncharacterized protein n=1 Tax=Corchorus olitorius TaxID=93759 RepID=A0A1R3I5N4_9ROSI|nr:hypothetical protein COLO4_24982 [Corchorus olitorius]
MDEEKGLDNKEGSEDNEVMEGPMIGEVLDFEKVEEPAFTITYIKQHKLAAKLVDKTSEMPFSKRILLDKYIKSSIKKSRAKARKFATKKSITKAGKRKLDFKYEQVKIGSPSLAHH